MQKIEQTTQKTLQALLSGKHPMVKKYAGKQVFVIGDKIVSIKEGKKGLADFKRLKKKYSESPVGVFVPYPGVSYILFSR